MEHERFIKLEDKVYRESDVEDMDVQQISELMIDIDYAIMRTAESKKKYISYFGNNKNDYRYQENMQRFTFILNKFHEAQAWVSLIKRKKNMKLYENNKVNQRFVDLARDTLKDKVFVNLWNKAKETA